MAAQGNEEKRKYERRSDARRGALTESTLEEMMEEPPPAEKGREFKGSNQRFADRRTTIRRKADQELHNLLMA